MCAVEEHFCPTVQSTEEMDELRTAEKNLVAGRSEMALTQNKKSLKSFKIHFALLSDCVCSAISCNGKR